MADKLSPSQWVKLNANPAVRAAVMKRAQRVLARAEQLSRAGGGKANYRLDAHVRPGGRFVVNVVSDSPAEEFGTDDTPRIGALRRAVRGE